MMGLTLPLSFDNCYVIVSLQDEADHGIIEKVSLKNFMCHNRLEVTFGPNVNFIIGRNGSKSDFSWRCHYQHS